MFQIEEWDAGHPRYAEFIECLQIAAPEQAQFVEGGFFQSYPCHLLVAIQDERVAGFLRFAVVPIGAETGCPALEVEGKTLLEAKIHAFAVQPDCRGQGIGTALQKRAIRLAGELGCYQLASYSLYEKEANYHIKLALGFGVQPEVHGDEKGAYFILPLRNT